MLTKPQLAILLTWVFGPIVLFLVLLTLNSTFELQLVSSKTLQSYPIVFLILLEVATFVILVLGFRRINYVTKITGRSARAVTTQNVILALVTFLLLVVPILIIVVVFPAIALLSSNPGYFT